MKYTYIALLIIIILLIVIIVIISNNDIFTKMIDQKNKKIIEKQLITEKSEFIRRYIQILNYTVQNLEKEFPTIKNTLSSIKQKLLLSSQLINNDPTNIEGAFAPLYSATNDLQTCFIYIISLRNLKYEKKYLCSFVNDLYNLIMDIDFKEFNEKIENSIFLLKEFVIYNFYFTKLRTVVKERDIKLYLQFINNLFLYYISKINTEEIKNLINFEIKKTKNIMIQVENMNKRLNYLNNI